MPQGWHLKTGELIAALAQDRLSTPSPARLIARTLPLAVLAAAVLLLATAGPRHDFAQVLGAPRFLFKFLVTLSLAVPAVVLLPRVATPLPRTGGWMRALWLAPAVLLAGVLLELAALPGARWVPSAVGHNALWCLAMVPMLAAAPLAASLYCLRQAAPADPARAGMVAGLASGALAATVYALHCTDDSPLFVALWYTIGVLFTGAVGAWLARRVARW
ncbi:MAG TPA: NrsF family protein [Steroidobacteraceae bacterium]|nr:NrsF family protein [Steroidobacteraceae bacterium]